MEPAQPASVVVVADSPAVEAAAPPATPIAPDLPPAPRVRVPLDMGATTFLLAGVGTAGVVGASAFLTDPLSSDVVLRMSLGAGKAFEGALPTTWAGGRLDTCYVMAGNYADGQGMHLGLCGGADVGATLFGSVDGRPAQTLPFVDIGPTVEIGAELGRTFTLLLRAGVGLAVTTDAFVDGAGDRINQSPGTERAEVGLSWKLP